MASSTSLASPLFVFKKPLHSRTTDASGAQRIVYTFPVGATESLCGTYDGEENLVHTLHALLAEERSWLVGFVESFLAATKSYFAKPYSSSVILRHLSHRVASVTPPAGPVAFTPTAIIIVQGQFGIDWAASQDSIDIQIPDEEEALEAASAAHVSPANTVIVPTSAAPVPTAASVSAKASAAPVAPATEGLSAVDADALPYTAAGDVLSLRTPEQQAQERRRVREAHLRAKLAQYKAERTMTKYIQKYGDDLSYSSSESEWDTEGEEGSESESE